MFPEIFCTYVLFQMLHNQQSLKACFSSVLDMCLNAWVCEVVEVKMLWTYLTFSVSSCFRGFSQIKSGPSVLEIEFEKQIVCIASLGWEQGQWWKKFWDGLTCMYCRILHQFLCQSVGDLNFSLVHSCGIVSLSPDVWISVGME